jgi:DNA modification methylase
MTSVLIRDADFTLHVGDALETLKGLDDGCVDCCVTSPPYWGLRDYGAAGQLGLEASPEEYVAGMVAVFAEVRRVLADTGTLWLNLGDSYASSPPGNVEGVGKSSGLNGANDANGRYRGTLKAGHATKRSTVVAGLKPKDLCGIPWRVAFALQADGWYLRSDIIWSKPNPMPESVRDRPTKAHEYVFLLSKSPRYYFDADSVREPLSLATVEDARYKRALAGETPYGAANGKAQGLGGGPRVKFAPERNDGNPETMYKHPPSALGRNARSVWEIATQPYPEAHFATFPEELPRRCILAGCPEGGTVLDPFLGSGTTALVARQHGRRSIGIELNPVYARLAARRLQQLSLFATPNVRPG